MNEERIREISARAVAVILRSMDRVSVHFPVYANAVRGEVWGPKMTNERWGRVYAALASFRAIPGNALCDVERESRAFALRLMAAVEKMMAITVGIGRIDEAIEFAEMFVNEIAEQFPETATTGNNEMRTE